MNDRLKAEKICANTVRFLAADAIEKAASGHPGLPMGLAETAVTLWSRFLKFDPADPQWPDRDRFILSAGHGSMLNYALLHLAGYDLSLADLKAFRQWDSRTPGHPEAGLVPGVETTTGPLGQGFANAVGMALAERMLAARFNGPKGEIVGHRTFVLAGDGDLMEGIAYEAASLAGHLGLGRLVAIYDSNQITIEGSTDLTFTEDVPARFEAMGWQVIREVDGHDPEAVANALTTATDQEAKPALVVVNTRIGYGAPTLEGSEKTHGSPLGTKELQGAKEKLGWPGDKDFHIPTGAGEPLTAAASRGQIAHQNWLKNLATWQETNPAEYAQWQKALAGELPADLASLLPSFPVDPKGMASRASSGKVLNALAPHIPELIGGSADLGPSNKSVLTDFAAVQPGEFKGRNLHFGIREHSMGAILNGLALHGGFIPYGATFLVFSDYMRPAIRMAALMKLRVIYIFTHDSIGVGEDGPTHQPIEHVASLRAIPNLDVVRPADAQETAHAWEHALTRAEGPTALILSRQGLPTLDRQASAPASDLKKGAYILKDANDAQAILLASGSEIPLALAATDLLAKDGIKARVVSMPCWEAFATQPATYRDKVLDPKVKVRLAVEAGIAQGWERWIGDGGTTLTIDRFGASAPAKTVFEKFGFTAEETAKRVKALLTR